MTYHAGFKPEAVFTAPLKRGSVIVPLGVPLGTSTFVSSSMGISNLPERNNWTGPASSGSESESGVGNWEMSAFVPIEAKGGIRLHPGPGQLAASPGPFPARAMSSSSADTVTEKSVMAAAVAEISTEPARLSVLQWIMTSTSGAELKPVD